jgi:hypothetical protein
MKFFLSFITATLVLFSGDMFVCKKSTIIEPNGEFNNYKDLNIVATTASGNLLIALTDKNKYSLEYKQSGKTKDGHKFDMYSTADGTIYAGVYDNFKEGITMILKTGYKIYISECKKEKE